MKALYIVRTSGKAVLANKVRSGLTVLGIVIGITAIMLIVSIGQGAKDLILGEIQGMGAETIVLRPGRSPQGPSDFAQTLFADSLKKRDIEALQRKENVPDLVSLAPVVMISESVSYGGETYRPTIFGWSAEFMQDITTITMKKGAIFDEADIRQEASVAIIGEKVERELFGSEDSVGKNIRIKGHNFRIVAVMDSSGASSFMKPDEMVVIPYSTAQTFLTGKDHFQEVMVKASSPEAVARTVQDIEATLREMHNLDDAEKNDFYIETQQGVIDQIGTILAVLTAFLSAVSAISLVVGGVGVMNVMLVSVTERTREIGLRKALGARNSDILSQFLIESVLLTFLGGVIGIALGLTFGLIASLALTSYLAVDWQYAFPLQATLIGLVVAAGVGLVFGGYPAWKASRKSPIEALRYE